MSSTVIRTPATLALSRRTAFWAVALAFFAVTAFSTAPSSLYGLYAQHDHASPIALTFAYAIYALGTVASLLLAGHLSDVHGRRAVLVPSITLAIAAAAILVLWQSYPALLVARVITGLAVGAAVATATAYLTDLNDGTARRAGIVATIANIGGLAAGPLIAALLTTTAQDALVLPFEVLLAALALALVAVLVSPDGIAPVRPAPRYRPQRLSVPAGARAAIAGVFLSFAVFGLFAGLAGRFLAGPLHHSSPVLAGLSIFLTFVAGVLVQTTTTRWPAHRLLKAGIAPMIAGLGLLVAAAWASPPSLALFLAGGVVAGAGGGAIFRGSLTVVIQSAGGQHLAGALATFFTVGYAGLTVPVVGAGVAFEHLSPRVTLLAFAVVVTLGILAAAPTLVRRPQDH
jgi:predicted MFS family arabinose efflux permease